MMLSTRPLLLLLLIFPAAIFPILVQPADKIGPIRRANIISHCGKPLQGTNALLAPGRTVVSLIVKDDLVSHLVSMSVGNGTSSTNYTLSIDIGSANTFVGADRRRRPYVQTSSSMNTTLPVSRSYGDRQGFQGFEFFDNITLGCFSWNQSIAVPSVSHGFEGTGVDGILGIGPTQLTIDSITPKQSIPTITDNLAAMDVIPSRTVAFSFKPRNESSSLTGEITWGGIDQSNIVGDLIYVPITKTQVEGVAGFVGINASIFYDNKPLLSNGAGIIDSGATNLALAKDIFDLYGEATGVKMGRFFSSISRKDYAKLKPLVFVIGNSSFSLTPDGQRLPPSTSRKYYKSNTSKQYDVIIGPNDRFSSNGSAFTLGLPWFRRFFVVYDSDNERVGVANTSYRDAIFD